MALDADLARLADEELMGRYRDGEAAAFDVLVRRHRDGVLNFLCRMVRDRSVAEEIQAEVFFRVHRSAPRYEPSAKFTTFLYTIAYRQCLSAVQRKEHRVRTRSAAPDDWGRAPADADGGRPAADPERRLILEERMERLAAEVDDLPETHRAAFLLYYLEGLSCQEIAGVLSLSGEEVKGRLAYARRLLRERMGGE